MDTKTKRGLRQSLNRRRFLKLGTGIGAGLALGGTGLAGEAAARGKHAKGDEFMEIMHTRRSAREFEPTQIPDDHLQMILDAARTAPTAGNQQPWKFLVVRDEKMIDRIRERALEAQLGYRIKEEMGDEAKATARRQAEDYVAQCTSAKTFVVVLTDNESNYPSYNWHDGPLAAGYLILAARSLGYGSVYYTDSISETIIKDVFDMDDRYKVVCTIPLGIPKEWPAKPDKKDLADLVAYDSL
ncbi:MAG: nitroreductase family protein [bacterium]|nr:nitroreductase family protein [bacterium]